eukprot:TRINITY_DN15499_c0_g2_i1.p1 TRINITY_DN15499_c0_g2~~TRINITY_DN15499_c0_g2_i1.p1  ORF type:complete len:1550 (-),score=357.19 TRINITY_DN15499_c0_g2_i1:72-4721(-)
MPPPTSTPGSSFASRGFEADSDALSPGGELLQNSPMLPRTAPALAAEEPPTLPASPDLAPQDESPGQQRDSGASEAASEGETTKVDQTSPVKSRSDVVSLLRRRMWPGRRKMSGTQETLGGCKADGSAEVASPSRGIASLRRRMWRRVAAGDGCLPEEAEPAPSSASEADVGRVNMRMRQMWSRFRLPSRDELHEPISGMSSAESDGAEGAAPPPRDKSPSRRNSLASRSMAGSASSAPPPRRSRLYREAAKARMVRNKDEIMARLGSLRKYPQRLGDEWKMIRKRIRRGMERAPIQGQPVVMSVEMVQPRDPEAKFEMMYRAQLCLATGGREHTWYTEPFTLDDLVVVVVKARQLAIESRLCSQVGWCTLRLNAGKSVDDALTRIGSGRRWNDSRIKRVLTILAQLAFYAFMILVSVLCVYWLATLLQPLVHYFQLSLEDSLFVGSEWFLSLGIVVPSMVLMGSFLAGVLEIAILPAKAILHFERKETINLVTEQLHLLLNTGNCFQNLDVCNFLNLGMATYTGLSETLKEGRVWCRRHESTEMYFLHAGRRRLSFLCCTCEWRCRWRKNLQSSFEERWCVLRKDGISLFSSVMSKDPTDALYFDSSFSIFRDGQDKVLVCCASWVLELHVAEPWRTWQSETQSLHRQGSVLSWCNAITASAQRSPCTKLQRFGSFAPLRYPIEAKLGGGAEAIRLSLARFLVGGRAAFRKIAEAIQLARREIFIVGWWITPDLPLTREGPDLPGAPDSRLFVLLRAAADRGVRVHVLLWQETYLPNDAEWTEEMLAYPGIFVVRHRSRFDINLLWSHHEKVVVVDQQLAMLGGLDLCLGRYDDPAHRLDDVAASTWAGQDYSNPRVSDFMEVRVGKDLLDRRRTPRMPWQDVHCMLMGLPALDAARHCIERWNYAKSKKPEYSGLPTAVLRTKLELSNDSVLPLVSEAPDTHWPPECGDWHECSSQLLRSVGRWSAGTRTESSVHAAYCDLIQGAEHFIYIENQFFCSGFDGDDAVGNRVVEALLQRVLRAHQRKEPFHVMMVLPLLPALEGVLGKTPSPLLYVLHYQYRTLRGFRRLLAEAGVDFGEYVSIYGLRMHGKLEEAGIVTEEIYVHSKTMIVDDRHVIIGSANLNDRSLLGTPRMPWQDVHCMLMGLPALDAARHCIERWNYAKSKKPEYSGLPTAVLRTKLELSNDSVLPLVSEAPDTHWPPECGDWHECSSQLLRSVGRWSAGTRTESSVHAAYCDLIQGAEHFIYIENQFFCSGFDGDDAVGNRVVEALLQRVLRAHQRKEPFHVMMVLPLLPALEGVLGKTPSPLLYVLHYQYRTLRGFRRLLAEAGVDFGEYVSIYGLRMHGKLEEAGIVTEEIYVHSKTMIVDDRHVIIGSANLNDRSLLGMRDSEVCVVVQDAPPSSGSAEVLAPSAYRGVAGGLRRALLSQHMGWSPEEADRMMDESSLQELVREIRRVAGHNTRIYESLFAVVPSDSVRTWAELAARRAPERATGDVMRTPAKAEAEAALREVQGHIVQFPLDFLIEEDLAPSASAVALKPTCWQPDAFC